MASPAGSASSTPMILLVLVAAALAAGASAIPFTVNNRCPFTVWPALDPAGGGTTELRPGSNSNLDVPEFRGVAIIWGRTGCSFDKTGRGRCKTGDDHVSATTAYVSTFKASYHYGFMTYKGSFNLPLEISCSSGNTLRCGESGCHNTPLEACDNTSGSRLQLVFCP